MKKAQHICHPLEPVFDADSRVLILGTMPSPKSREAGFYYSHPQNRFWPLLSELLDEPLPRSNEERKALLLRHRIALWDVLQSCDIVGADDGSIRNPVPNDLNRILRAAPIRALYTTGTKAAVLYKKYCLPQTKRDAAALPSTSPANCRHDSYDRLKTCYQTILNDL